jgi:AAA15 family ATPase/GTPase
MNERSKASYEFFIKSTVNGQESLQSPKDANGGGFVDIISVAAKYAYLELFNDPKIQCGTVFLDEPGKMIDEQRSIKFAEYIKELGRNYNKQTIMITHNTSLKDIADQTYYVSQNNNLISNVTEIIDVPLQNIESTVEEELNGHSVQN